MSSNVTTGRFDGREANFSLTDSDLVVDIVGQETISVSFYTIVIVTHDADQEEDTLHLFQTAIGEDWNAKNIYYEKHTANGLPESLLQQFRPDQSGYDALRSTSEGVSNHWVCISTLSGTGASLNFFDKALSPLLSALKIEGFEVLKTTSADSVTDFCKEVIVPRANDGVEQTIILLSGDGGPVDMINAFAKDLDSEHAKIATIALIPLGSGNALANSSGINQDKTFGVRSMLRGHPHPVPTFQVNLSPGSQFVTNEGQSRTPIPISKNGTDGPSIYGAVVCSWGFHASLVADSDTVEYRKHGTERFKMAAQELLAPSDGSSPHIYRGKVTVFINGGQEEIIGNLEHAYTLLTYASQLEQGFTISPSSQPLDGQLRLVHFGPLPSDEVMRLMGLAYQGGKHVDDPNIQYVAVDGMRIDFDEEEERWRRICIDGKIVVVEKGGSIEVRPGRTLLNLIAPQDTV